MKKLIAVLSLIIVILSLSGQDIAHPQEPKKPYPYREEEVSIVNSAASDVVLAGTLTLPEKLKKPCPAVILVSGSGQQNRDSKIFGHKPFLVIADYLTRQGIAVLRYDDRGVFGSTGTPDTCTTYDFSLDAEAVFNYLKNRKEINPQQIGIIGHSEGGMIASIVAARNNEVAFIILLAAPGVRGDSLMLLQRKLYLMSLTKGLSEAQAVLQASMLPATKVEQIIINTTDTQQMRKDIMVCLFNSLKEQMPEASESKINKMVQQNLSIFTSKWWQYFIKYDAVSVLQQLKCPVLAFNGEKDIQVSAVENLSSIERTLTEAGNKDLSVYKLPNINHLFQTCTTGAISEYAQIRETFSPKVLKIMAKWIKRHTK